MKRITLTPADIFNVPTARIYNPDSLNKIEAVTIDSRHVPHNALFIAIKGDKFDGHNFIGDAVANGAAAVLVNEKKYRNFTGLEIPLITVKDTVKAFGYLAAVWRNKLDTKIIALTGSAGKTSVKEYLSILLNEKYTVNKTLANNNNHIGVPLTILSTTNKHDYLVLELGTNHFGEIEYTAGIARPDYALITNIGSSHLEYFKDKKGVLKEKSVLFKSTIENNGIIFINNDDPFLEKSYPEYRKRLSYSLEGKADIQGTVFDYTEDGRAVIEVKYPNGKFTAELSVWGDQAAKNFIAAAAVSLKAGLNKKQITDGIKKLKTYNKRFDLKKLNDTIIIDDTYNANPDSMKNAILTLQKIYPGKKKIAVLGDMLELGASSPELHKNIAGEIRKAKIDKVFTIGSMSENIYKTLNTGPVEVRHFISRSSLKRFLERQDFSGAVVLFKGSRGMKMEEFLQVTEEKLIS